MTCLDNPIGHFTSRPSCDGRKNLLLGWDPEPADLALTPQILVVGDVINRMASADVNSYQPHIWVERNDTYDRQGMSTRSSLNRIVQNTPFFVTAFPNNTQTGVLRQHIMRMSYTTNCAQVSKTDFPATCSGSAPFAVSYTAAGSVIRVCAPGDHTSPLFTISRDRQDVSEDLFIDMSLAEGGSNDQLDVTWHCTANTSRGYFQLGNYVNKNVHGGLNTHWTSPSRLADHFNDYLILRNPKLSYPLPTNW